MNYEEILIERIESFVDVVENFVGVEHQIIHDSKYRKHFRKPNYELNIETLNDIKVSALNIDIDDVEIPADDEQSLDVAEKFERCLVLFNKLCDGFIDLQDQLKQKAERTKKFKITEYQEVLRELQGTRTLMNSALQTFHEAYTEYVSFDEDEIEE
jgi:CRISPR/Cas system CMR-associated protein Cmr3 (group 5 of RAMP superfamily)